jgi:cytochrome c556
MSPRKLTAVALAGLLAASVALGAIAQDAMVDPAIAGMSAEEKVEARQAAMRENGGILRNLGTMSAADAATATQTLIQNFTNLPELFAPDTIVGDSKATPLIWEDKAAFDAIFAQAREHAVAAKTAADGGDVAGAAAAAGQIGALCGACHTKYRAS